MDGAISSCRPDRAKHVVKVLVQMSTLQGIYRTRLCFRPRGASHLRAQEQGNSSSCGPVEVVILRNSDASCSYLASSSSAHRALSSAGSEQRPPAVQLNLWWLAISGVVAFSVGGGCDGSWHGASICSLVPVANVGSPCERLAYRLVVVAQLKGSGIAATLPVW
jgi:hypothetical protein